MNEQKYEKKIKALISFCDDILAECAWLRGEILKENGLLSHQTPPAGHEVQQLHPEEVELEV